MPMSKRAAVDRARGAVNDDKATESVLLRCDAVVRLAQELSEAIRASTGAKRRPSRSSCAQLALQVLLVAVGLRRAALVDVLSLTTAQAAAVGSKLSAVSRTGAFPESDALRHVCLLFHAPSSQTFVLSRRPELWAKKVHPTMWVDCRAACEHASPTLTEPDAHVTSLITAVSAAVQGGPADAFLVPFPSTEEPTSEHELQSDAQLAGIALAGFLLEYAAVYRLHSTSTEASRSKRYCYQVRALHTSEGRVTDVDFIASPNNSLASAPLILFRVMWASPSAGELELLSFSIPQHLVTKSDTQTLRSSLIVTFQDRIHSISRSCSPFAKMLASGSISVETTSVTLHQVAL